MTIFGDFVGFFWRPNKLNRGKAAKIIERNLWRFSGKPRVRLHRNPEYGMFVVMYGEAA